MPSALLFWRYIQGRARDRDDSGARATLAPVGKWWPGSLFDQWRWRGGGGGKPSLRKILHSRLYAYALHLRLDLPHFFFSRIMVHEMYITCGCPHLQPAPYKFPDSGD
jgi:hypothetical protein